MAGIIGLAVGLVLGASVGVVIAAVLVTARDVAEYDISHSGMPEEVPEHDNRESD